MPSPLGQDRCEALPGGRWRLACAPGRGWKARRARTFTSPETPGTAVRWEGTIWEVLEAGPAPGGGERYVLAPWDQRCVVRDLYDYGAAAEFARGREERDWTWRLRRRRIALLLAPLTGLLPGAVQARMELDWDLPAVAVTLISAVPLFFLGGYCAILSEVTQVAGAAGPPSGILLVGGYVFAESALRIGVAFCLSRPAGSVVGWVAYQVWRLAAGRRYEVSDTALSFSGGALAPCREQALRDRFVLLESLLALLPPLEQQDLARGFGFDPLRWGRATAAALGAVAGLNALASLAGLAGGVASAADLVWLAASSVVLFEQVARWRRFGQGKAAGSLFGFLVRPLARPLVRAAGSVSVRVS